jgi:hypothetical protein
MSHFFSFCLLLFTFISCSKPSELSNEFNCGSVNFENTKQISDFNKNFKISIPTSWKTKLYYDNFSSEIYAADTLKQFLETYIISTSYNLGEVNFNANYFKRNDSLATSKGLKIIQSKKIQFQSKESYYYLLKGMKNNFPYHQFQLTVKLTENSFFNSYIDIYGEDAVEERICEAITILDEIEFLQ